MKTALRRLLRHSAYLLLAGMVVGSTGRLMAEPLTLKRAVELALGHSTASGTAAADEQHAYASYREVRNQYVPQFVLGSGLGASWGFPLSLEGAAPSLVNLNAQSALLNPALRDFVRAARFDWQATAHETKSQRDQVIQDTVASYLELNRWEGMVDRMRQDEADAARTEQLVEERIQAGVDSQLEQNKARLASARARLRLAQATGAGDVLRDHLAQLTGLSAASIETAGESIPPLPPVQQTDNLAAKAVESSPSVQAATDLAVAQGFRARGEHRSLWPSIDFAAQYALLSTYNNYNQFYKSFQRHNATLGVAIRFPFLNFSQRARAEGADAQAVRTRSQAVAAKNQVSAETLRLERSVEQLAAGEEVANLEYQIAQTDLETAKVRMDSSSGTLHELADARVAWNERYSALQDARFQLTRARIALLRATGELEDWVGVGK
jgi:outer membrane protein